MTFLVRRLLLTIPLLLAVSLIVFALSDSLPGDAADLRFEYAARLRDEIKDLKREMRESA